MRTFTVAFLTIGLLLQVGCTLAPKLTMSSTRKAKPDQKAAEKYLAARRLEGQGKFERARECYDELIAKYPENPDYLHRQGVVCTQLQRFPEAEKFYERARQQDPKNASLLTDMGYSSYVRGDLVKAERRLREALQLKPSYKRATSNLALVVGAQGKTDESLKLLREVGDEASALAGVAYIHSRRGESDLAEQLYRESLVLNPKLEDAIQGLALLAKQKQLDEMLLAKKAEKENSESKSDASNIAAKSNEIQQVAATKKAESKTVKTALFTDELPETDEPSVIGKKEDASNPEHDDFDAIMASVEAEKQDEEAASDVLVKNSRAVAAKDSGWDEDELAIKPAKTKTSKKPSAVVQADFELTNGEDDPFAPQPTQQPTSTSESSNVSMRKPSLTSDSMTESDDDGDQDLSETSADENE